MANIKQIIILFGGSSSEREVSIKSGEGIFQACQDLGYDAKLVDLNNISDLDFLREFDIVFIALHGFEGESGTLQKDLDEMGYFEAFQNSEDVKTSEYSDWVEKKILTEGQERLVENTLGLVGEAGEVAEKIKKLIRDSNRFTNKEIMKELGDVVFYATALANIYGKGLQEVLELNIAKLDDRQKRGKLKGSGDNR